eukprot:gene14646-19677_t
MKNFDQPSNADVEYVENNTNNNIRKSLEPVLFPPRNSDIKLSFYKSLSFTPIVEDDNSTIQSLENQIGAESLDRNSFWNLIDEICWLNYPNKRWDICFYYTIRGAENFHIYLWILKDLSWTQDWYCSGYIFGILACFWSGYLLCHAIHFRNVKEIWACIAQLLWLVSNTIWMSAELHDHQFPNAPKLYPSYTVISGKIMVAALCFLGIYYIIIKPFNLFPASVSVDQEYDDTGLTCRFKYFKSWREYENIHILFWLGKDCAWNHGNGIMWIIFLIPTLLIALDFFWVSLFAKNLIVEHAHYFAQFVWVIGNLLWALGEIYYPRYDDPYSLESISNATARKTFRWYSSWVLASAYIPLVIMYIMWIYSTHFNPNDNIDTNDYNHMEMSRVTLLSKSLSNKVIVFTNIPSSPKSNKSIENDDNDIEAIGHQL